MEQTKAIEDLNKSRDKLEKMKEKAEKKLMSVKSELDTTEHEAKEDKERARNIIELVTSETKTLKKSLEEAEKREKQVGINLVMKSSYLGKIGRFKRDHYSRFCINNLQSFQYHFNISVCRLASFWHRTIVIYFAKKSNSHFHGMDCRKEKAVLIKAMESL